jgi:hypothetical protein
MMVLHVPSVQLQNQSALRNQPFILGAAVCALTTKQALIPAAARFDITHANEWLWVHTRSIVTIKCETIFLIYALLMLPMLNDELLGCEGSHDQSLRHKPRAPSFQSAS